MTYFPNGNVMTFNDSVDGDWVYGYDDFNRLTSAAFTNGGHGIHPASFSYAYDRFGNRWQQNVTSGTGPMSSLAFDANNHQPGLSYDAAGNMTWDGTNTYTYDAEERIATVPSLGGTYVYDAEGRRVAELSSRGASCFLLDLADNVNFEGLCSGGRSRAEVFIGGRHLHTYSFYSSFNHPDYLGTEHFRSEPTAPSRYEDCFFYPYGEMGFNGSCNDDYTRVHFTGKEREQSNMPIPTGLDYFGARFYVSSYAHFMTPDWAAKPAAVPFANYGNPQSLNLYAYVENNPTTTADLDGHCGAPGTPNDNCAAANTLTTGIKNPTTGTCANSGTTTCPTLTSEATEFVKVEAVGMAKGTANNVIRLTNLVDDVINTVAGTNLQYPEFTASSAGEKQAMLGTSIGLMLIPGGDEAEAPEAISAAKAAMSKLQVDEKGTSIIGAGTTTALRQAERLASEYGGNAGDWAKMSSSSYHAADGSVLSTHWYENGVSGLRVEFKSIYR